jgi:hypothetical protein
MEKFAAVGIPLGRDTRQISRLVIFERDMGSVDAVMWLPFASHSGDSRPRCEGMSIRFAT